MVDAKVLNYAVRLCRKTLRGGSEGGSVGRTTHGGRPHAQASLSADVRQRLLKNNQVQSIDVRDGQLNDEDVGQLAFANFPANISAIPPHTCVENGLDGLGGSGTGTGDHLLLTPAGDGELGIVQTLIDGNFNHDAYIRTCNPTDGTKQAFTAHFNLLVIDAQ